MGNTYKEQAIQKARQILRQNPIYLDTETTGLGINDEIVEIALMDDNENILYQSFVRPTQSIPLSTTAIHGITDEMVRNAPSWQKVWTEIRNITQNRLIAIYNADFDLRMMKQSMARYRLPWSQNFSTECIMKLYAAYNGEWDSRRMSYRFISLEQAGRQCGILLPNAHRALADVKLARALLHYIAES
ncbi:MAG: 3'-5' exonuclease [Anaerolineales bacterium]